MIEAESEGQQPFGLDLKAIYQIQVPGELDEGWIDWDGRVAVNVERYDDRHGDGTPVTTLTGLFDQAGLHGLLRQLYALGLPLISVTCVGCG